uniref:Uncharacterized protein n=1 Tax=Peronospora matthiolae TaxID=2874970 RepID=A0AAV1UTV7_9STRA
MNLQVASTQQAANSELCSTLCFGDISASWKARASDVSTVQGTVTLQTPVARHVGQVDAADVSWPEFDDSLGGVQPAGKSVAALSVAIVAIVAVPVRDPQSNEPLDRIQRID